ncbi:MAG: DUF4198 domain-containing protein [Chitinophagaceae bacterium]
MVQWNKRFLLLFSLLAFTLFLPAHEFWLQPEKFICERGETINIRFEAGENFQGENWEGDATRINSLRLYLQNAKDDLTEQVTATGDSLQLAMFDEGTAMVTFNSNNAYIEMDAAKFNDYLREDGLHNAIDEREKNHQANNPGKELYQRSVKTLIQVGTKTNNCFKQPTDLPLDIIAQNNPYLLKNNQPLVVKVLFNKKTLIDYDIRLWHRIHDTTLQQIIKTDQNGEIHFNVNTKGKWMASTVKMNRLKDDPKAEWQSYWGSLTWGY